jgi:hypothetical protein
MRVEFLSIEAQDGLRRWATDVHDDEMLFDAIASVPENWAWIWFQLREARDYPRWFPKGKWATIQAIEAKLMDEAREMYSGVNLCRVVPR